MDLRSSSPSSGVQLLKEGLGAHIPEDLPLQLKRKELKDSLERLQRYIIKSARNRVKQVKRGELINILQVIYIEMALSSTLGRMDLVENLLARQKEIQSLLLEVEQLEVVDYQKRFGLNPPQ